MGNEPRDRIHNIEGRLFQARMWREYAMALWDDGGEHPGDEWMKEIMRVSRADCIRRARVNVYLARRLNRRSAWEE